MQNSFQKLNKQDQYIMATTLAKAFHSHDNFVYLIEDPEKRLHSAIKLFRFMTKVMNKYGYIYVVYSQDKPIGYITFMDDSKNAMNAKTVIGSNALVLAARFWLSLSRKERLKYREYMKAYNTFSHEQNNLIHLYYTGILPEYQGKGIMKSAMKDALQHFKNLGYQGVTLETSDQGNIGLYKHLGYKITQRVKTKNERQEIILFEKDF